MMTAAQEALGLLHEPVTGAEVGPDLLLRTKPRLGLKAWDPMRAIRSLRQTPALVVSIAALLIALSGTSFAAVALVEGQVKTEHLAAGAVTGKKIKKNATNSGKVTTGSLRARDFQAGDLPAGPAGPAGAPAVLDRLVGALEVQPGELFRVQAGRTWHQARLTDKVALH